MSDSWTLLSDTERGCGIRGRSLCLIFLKDKEAEPAVCKGGRQKNIGYFTARLAVRGGDQPLRSD